jgi:copper chaperone CopZ
MPVTAKMVALRGESMKEYKLNVKGMHCPSCEALVKEDIGDIAGVAAVEADHKKGIVTVNYEGSLDFAKVKSTIAALGYEVKE